MKHSFEAGSLRMFEKTRRDVLRKTSQSVLLKSPTNETGSAPKSPKEASPAVGVKSPFLTQQMQMKNKSRVKKEDEAEKLRKII